MNITPDFVSNYSCGRGDCAIFMNLNREHLFRTCRKLPKALRMASQLLTAHGTWYHTQHSAGFAVPRGVSSSAVTLLPTLWHDAYALPHH